MFAVTTTAGATKAETYRELAAQLAALLAGESDYVANAANTSALIAQGLGDLNWAGFYFLRSGELVLGPFQGKVACVRLALGRGVCGTAAQRRETVVVPDVEKFPGHIACDHASRSEIVVPLVQDGQLLGVLDLDSPSLARFDDADRAGLEALAEIFLRGSDLAPLVREARPSPATLVVGGGCFWCLDAAFQLLPGVVRVTCGYAGGRTDAPTYEQVYTDQTGHVEVVRIEYDPAQVSLERVLEFFWQVHDATQTDGQGEDLGTRYRSVIYTSDDAQRRAAEKSRAAEQASLAKPVSTEISPLQKFWPAEAYHQNYFARHPERAYCAAVIKPKIAKLAAKLQSGAPAHG